MSMSAQELWTASLRRLNASLMCPERLQERLRYKCPQGCGGFL